jgi:hypothetical protein
MALNAFKSKIYIYMRHKKIRGAIKTLKKEHIIITRQSRNFQRGYKPILRQRNKHKLYSVFKNEFTIDAKDWIPEYKFFMGDLSDVDVTTDERFYEIPGQRKQAIYMGKGKVSFPVVYPILLDDGITLNKI